MDVVNLVFKRTGEDRVLMFPDASDLFRGCFLRQVSVADAASGKPVEQMEHKALAFLSEAFKGSQLNWPTVDKEAPAILSVLPPQLDIHFQHEGVWHDGQQDGVAAPVRVACVFGTVFVRYTAHPWCGESPG